MESQGESAAQNRKTEGRGACSPRPDSPVERERIEKLRAASDFRRMWNQEAGKRMMTEPNLFPPNTLAVSVRLLAPEMYFYGIDIQPIGFPAGTGPQDIRNYRDIIYGFSRGFGPQLFDEIHFSDPFPTGYPYWSNFFYQITPNSGRFLINVSQTTVQGTCLGETGNYQQGSNMNLLDCSGPDTVIHEIGHAVMDDGILAKRNPFFFSYSPVGVTHQVDTRSWLKQLFGNMALDSGSDPVDGLKLGFVSTYAITNAKEDFAETFMYYVYHPETLMDKVQRQSAMGSLTLEQKMELIFYLYKGVTFRDGGQVAGWSGMS